MNLIEFEYFRIMVRQWKFVYLVFTFGSISVLGLHTPFQIKKDWWLRSQANIVLTHQTVLMVIGVGFPHLCRFLPHIGPLPQRSPEPAVLATKTCPGAGFTWSKRSPSHQPSLKKTKTCYNQQPRDSGRALLIFQLEATNSVWKGYVTIPKKVAKNCQETNDCLWIFPKSKQIQWVYVHISHIMFTANVGKYTVHGWYGMYI